MRWAQQRIGGSRVRSPADSPRFAQWAPLIDILPPQKLRTIESQGRKDKVKYSNQNQKNLVILGRLFNIGLSIDKLCHINWCSAVQEHKWVAFHCWLKLPITFWCSFIYPKMFPDLLWVGFGALQANLYKKHSDQNTNLWPATAHTVPAVLPPHSSDFVVSTGAWDIKIHLMRTWCTCPICRTCAVFTTRFSRFTKDLVETWKPIKTYQNLWI